MSETSGQPSTEPASTTPAESTPAPATAASPVASAPSEHPGVADSKPASEAPADAPSGAPEKYEFKKTDGIEFGDAVIAKYSEIAKELNLPQEAAQKILNDVAPLIAKQQADTHKTLVESWRTQVTADKEIGGDKLNENIALAKRAMDAYFAPEFVKLLNDSGLGNHPEMIRGLMKAGKAVSQDNFVAGGNGASSKLSVAERLYGSSS